MKKVITSILTIVLSIPLFVSTPLADAHGPNNLIPTPYGTCTQEFYYEANSAHNITIGGITIPQQGPVNVIRYTFTHPYTGTFDLDLNNSSILNNIWNLMTSNCYLMSVVDGDTLRFAVNNAEYCEIAIMPSQYYNQLFISLKNQNLTAVEDTTTAVNSILSHVSYIDGQIQQIHADNTMIRNLIISMSGYSADSNDNIATDMDTLISALNTVNTNINKLNDVNWTTMSVNITYSDTLNGTYTDTLPNNNLTTVYARVEAPTNANTPYMGDFINKISFGLRSSYSSTPYYYVYLDEIYNYNYQPMNNVLLYYDNYSLGNTVYLNKNVFGNNDVNRYVYFKFSTSSGQFRTNGQTFYGYINSNNKEYWELLGFFNQNKYHDDYVSAINQVVQAINNMSMNVNQLTVNATGITYNVNNTQVNNSVTTYNTNINQVYNIENNFGTQLDTQLQNYNPDNTTIISRLTASGNIMATVLNGINGIELFTVPIGVMLVGIVLLAIVG